MEFEQLIRERYSVRSYKPEHLPKEAIDAILAAGHVAPTGCNKQPQRILVLNTEESMARLQGCTNSSAHRLPVFGTMPRRPKRR